MHPLVGALLAGESIASWAYSEPAPDDGLGQVGLVVRVDGDEVVLDGVKAPVEAVASSSHIVVTGRTGDGLSQVLVPIDASGLTVMPMKSVDLTRRFSFVRFDDVRVPASAVLGEVGASAQEVERQLRYAFVVLAAEGVGSDAGARSTSRSCGRSTGTPSAVRLRPTRR